MDYTIQRMTNEEEIAKVEEFIHDNFLPDMPLIIAFGLENRPPPRPNSNSTPTRHPDDIYLRAVDAAGETVGIAFNRVNPSFSMDAETPPAVKQEKASILQRHLQHLSDQIHIQKSRAVEMVEFMDFIEEEAELKKLPEKTIELRVLSVRSDWRQRGVARRLAEESMREARAAGFTAMRVCCTSEYTARLARSLGWREHYRLAYRDYPTLSGREVYLKPTPPHDLVYYYVTDL